MFEVLCLRVDEGNWFLSGVVLVFGVLIITYDTLGVAEWSGWMRRDISDDTKDFALNYEKTYCTLPEKLRGRHEATIEE